MKAQRLLAVASVAAFSVLTLSACGGGSGSSDNPAEATCGQFKSYDLAKQKEVFKAVTEKVEPGSSEALTDDVLTIAVPILVAACDEASDGTKLKDL